MAFDLTVLVDNRSEREEEENLRTEHGLSLLLAGGWGSLLVDAGASGDVLAHNADALGVDLAGVRQAVISHGHRDHGGGLGLLLRRCGSLRLYCGSGAFAARYTEPPGEPLRQVGLPFTVPQLEALGARIVEVDSPLRLDDGCILSGPVGGPPWGTDHFAVASGEELVPDRFTDEIFVMVRAARGWVLVSGCCHRGLANTLNLARFLAHDQPIHAVVGGIHLRGGCERDHVEAAAVLAEYGRPELFLGHCTPDDAVQYLCRHYAGPVRHLGVGDTLSF